MSSPQRRAAEAYCSSAFGAVIVSNSPWAPRAYPSVSGGSVTSNQASSNARLRCVWRSRSVAERLRQTQRNRALLDAWLEVTLPPETDGYARGAHGELLTMTAPNADEQYASAARRWGLDIDQLPEAEVVSRFREQPEVFLQAVSAGLSHWLRERRRQRPAGDWRRL